MAKKQENKESQALQQYHEPERSMNPDFSRQGLDQTVRMAKYVANSGLVPPSYNNKPEAVMVAAELGSRHGWSLVQSCQAIMVLKGKTMIWGDYLASLIDTCDDLEMWVEGPKAFQWLMKNEKELADTLLGKYDKKWQPDQYQICIIKREGREPVITIYDMERAKREHGGKDSFNKFKTHPERNLLRTARRHCAQDAMPAKLAGFDDIADEDEKSRLNQEILENPPEELDAAKGEFRAEDFYEGKEQAQDAEIEPEAPEEQQPKDKKPDEGDQSVAQAEVEDPDDLFEQQESESEAPEPDKKQEAPKEPEKKKEPEPEKKIEEPEKTDGDGVVDDEATEEDPF